MQSASLPGRSLNREQILRRASSRAFLAASLAREASRAFENIAFATAGFFFKIGHQLLIDRCRDELGYVGVAELALCLSLELSLGEFDADNGSQSLADIVTRELLVAVFENGIFASVVVENAGQSGLEAGLMSTAVNGVDVVCKREHCLRCSCLYTAWRSPRFCRRAWRRSGSAFHAGSLTAACGQIFDEARKSAFVAVGALDDIIGVAPVRRVMHSPALRNADSRRCLSRVSKS